MFRMIQSNMSQYLANPSSIEHKELVEEDIKYIYKEEFYDSIEKLLKENESSFMSSFKSRAIEVLKSLLPSTVWEDESFQEIIQKAEQETYSALYKPALADIQNGYNGFINSHQKKYLASFIPHCESNTSPIHNCEEKGAFIPIKVNEKVKFVLCNKCKMCYYANMIIMKCDSCNISFYSSYISPLDKMMPPSTWEMYHCDIIRNEQMNCIKCGDLFWLKGEELHCRKCKFLINPLEVAWKCVQCSKEFRAKAKVYNPLENLIIKQSTKQALINKKIITPRELPCNCTQNILDIAFVHNEECDGRVYLGDLDGQLILVCSKCCVFSSLNKFEWHCPLCKIPFYTTNIAQVINNGGNMNKKSQRHTLAISLGKNEDKGDGIKKGDSKEIKEKETKNEYKILYGNENQGYQQNRFMIRPEKEELFDKTEIKKIVKKTPENNKEQIQQAINIENKDKGDSQFIPSSFVDFIKLSMDDITIISKENDILSQVIYNDKDYSLLIIPYSNEISSILKNYKRMENMICIYGYNQEDKVFNVLIEKISNTLLKEIKLRVQDKEAKLQFKESEIINMILQCSSPLQVYFSTITPDRFILTQDPISKWKFSPLPTDGTSHQYIIKNTSNLNSFALLLVYSVSLDENIVNECKTIITKKGNDELIKFIMSSFRGKYSVFFCELLVKLLSPQSIITFKQLVQMLNE